MQGASRLTCSKKSDSGDYLWKKTRGSLREEKRDVMTVLGPPDCSAQLVDSDVVIRQIQGVTAPLGNNDQVGNDYDATTYRSKSGVAYLVPWSPDQVDAVPRLLYPNFRDKVHAS